MIEWRIGCSGFSYTDWKEVFYPKGLPQRKWFEYYCTRFNTVELNVTFYRFPQVSTLQSWYNRSPGAFTFSVKAPRIITHYKKLEDCKELLVDFYSAVSEGLKEKAACILFQFPPQFTYTPEKLDKIIDSLNPSFANVVEFRHESWWSKEIFKELGKNKICVSGMSYPSLPDEVVVNTDFVYYRMHGVPKLYRSSYSIDFLRNVAFQIKEAKKVKKVFVYFNNDYDGVGIKNAEELIKIIDHQDPLKSI